MIKRYNVKRKYRWIKTLNGKTLIEEFSRYRK
jgi:hypothetical protein